MMKNISIVGSGPSGFYTAYQLLKKCGPNMPLNITIWEKLPTPFGLSRYGVAPDHPEVKNCEATFMDLMEQNNAEGSPHKINFVGNCNIDGPKLKKLREVQDAVVLSYGCGDDRKLGITGESNTIGVVSSRNFVNWYNSYPSFKSSTNGGHIDDSPYWQTPEFWKNVNNVGIIGNGNVALDLTRVLLLSKASPGFWANTDINKDAVKMINSSNLRNVKIIGRRGYQESKFTNKEFRELWELEQYGIKGILEAKYLENNVFDPSDRQSKRRSEMVTEFQKPFEQRSKKYQKYAKPDLEHSKYSWELDYLKTPVEIIKDSQKNRINKLVSKQNQLIDGKLSIDEKKPAVEYPIDLLITSLGYKGANLDEPGHLNNIKFNARSGYIENKNGVVLDAQDKIIPGLFCSGWIKKGSSGVIATTMMDAFSVAEHVLHYLTNSKNIGPSSFSSDNLVRSVMAENPHSSDNNTGKPTVIDWEDWLTLNKHEFSSNGVRSKVIDIPSILEIMQKHRKSN